MNQQRLGALFVISAMCLFGFIGIFVRFMGLSAITIACYTFLIAGILLLGYGYMFRRSELNISGCLGLIGALALFNMGNNLFYFLSFQNTTISNSVFTHYTAPIFVAVLAPLLLKEKLERMTIPALFLSTIGMMLILFSNFSLQSQDFIGIVYGILSGFCYALVFLVVKQLSKKISLLAMVGFSALCIGLMLLPFVLFMGEPVQGIQWLWILGYVALFSMTATLIHSAGIKRIPSQEAAILSYAEILAATGYAFLFFREIPTLFALSGGALIVLSGYLIIRGQKT